MICFKTELVSIKKSLQIKVTLKFIEISKIKLLHRVASTTWPQTQHDAARARRFVCDRRSRMVHSNMKIVRRS